MCLCPFTIVENIMNQVSEGGACFSEDINKIEEQNKSCDSLEVSFTSHGIFVPCVGPIKSEISTHMNSVQGRAESISCNVNISLTQENIGIARNREVLEDDKDMKTYQRKKRQKVEWSDLLRTNQESFNEGADSSLGNVHPTIESSSLDQPVEFESVPLCLSSSVSEKREAFEDGISTEVVQKSLDESLYCCSEFQKTSLNKYDRTQIGASDDTSENADADMYALMLPGSRPGNGKVLDAVSTETDADEFPGVASSVACCKDFPLPLGIKEQCLSKHATTTIRNFCDADVIVSDQLEELHDEGKETVSIVDGDALGRDTPLYHEEQSVASHADLSLEQLDGTQGVASQLVCESINVPVDRAFASCKQKKLLVLDVNGLLLDISSYIPYDYHAYDIIMKKAVFRRPHCADFLNFCFEKFNVGFWTSRTKRNMEPLLDFLLGNNKSRLLFHWDQFHCTDTGFYTVEKRHKPLLLKKLKKLWDKCEPGLPWERGVYNESNTLLLDDTPYKALSNPQYTAVFPYSYRFTDVRDNSLGPGGDLRVYLEGLAEAENVQEYVKQNPFGQRPITEKNLSWGYYRKVIQANSTPPRQTDTDNP
ncbi:Haloacid dehalogenase-like hydrolase superfamily protein [Perilla frutescens var. frutescens]|nr:Haloacid dehalogenase-like hydrolase superfamily protein [Perilla frutescens var. frutescens]